MPNTVVPGFEEILGPALQGLVKTVGNAFKPNALFQKKMQEQLATNPELVVKLAGLEAKAPGTLGKMGFADNQISEITPQESPEDEFKRRNRPGILAGAEAAQASATVGAQVTAAEGKAMMEVLADPANAGITKEAALAIVRKPIQAGQLAQQAVDIGKTRAKFILDQPEGKVNMYDVVRQQHNGTLPPGVLVSYMADPVTKDAYEAADAQFKMDLELAARTTAMKNAKKDTATDRVDARQQQNAFLTYQKSGFAGTIDAWHDFLYDPQTQKHAADLLSGKIKPNGFADENLLEVAKGASKVGISRFNSDVNVLNNQGIKLLKSIDAGLPPDERNKAVADLNATLEKRSKLDGSPKITAKWHDYGFKPGEIFSTDRLEYFDEKGKPVDPDKVERQLADPAVQAQLSTRGQTALGRINTITDDATLEAALAKYEGDDNSPGKQDSKSVRAELIRMGRIK